MDTIEWHHNPLQHHFGILFVRYHYYYSICWLWWKNYQISENYYLNEYFSIHKINEIIKKLIKYVKISCYYFLLIHPPKLFFFISHQNLFQTFNLFKTCKFDKRKECYTRKFTLKICLCYKYIIEDFTVDVGIVLINISIIRYSMAPVCNIFYLYLIVRECLWHY